MKRWDDWLTSPLGQSTPPRSPIPQVRNRVNATESVQPVRTIQDIIPSAPTRTPTPIPEPAAPPPTNPFSTLEFDQPPQTSLDLPSEIEPPRQAFENLFPLSADNAETQPDLFEEQVAPPIPAALDPKPSWSLDTSRALFIPKTDNAEQRMLSKQLDNATEVLKSLPNIRFVRYEADGTPSAVLQSYDNLYDYYIDYYGVNTPLYTVALIDEEAQRAESADAKRLLSVQLLQSIDALLAPLEASRERNCSVWARLFGGDADYNDDAVQLLVGALYTARNYLCTSANTTLGDLEPTTCQLN